MTLNQTIERLRQIPHDCAQLLQDRRRFIAANRARMDMSVVNDIGQRYTALQAIEAEARNLFAQGQREVDAVLRAVPVVNEPRMESMWRRVERVLDRAKAPEVEIQRFITDAGQRGAKDELLCLFLELPSYCRAYGIRAGAYADLERYYSLFLPAEYNTALGLRADLARNEQMYQLMFISVRGRVADGGAASSTVVVGWNGEIISGKEQAVKPTYVPPQPYRA